jgi:hypothetical protein
MRSREQRGRMGSFSLPQVAAEAQHTEANRQEVVACIARAIPDDGWVEPLKGLYLARSSARIGPVYGVSEPSLCVIAQGSKEVFLGEER